MNRHQKEYIHRINKVILHIDANLDRELSVANLASVANFSPFHFHRIFSAFTGESIIYYVKRKRLEKAASLLLNDKDITIGEIANRCGYNSLSVFCRNFKDYYKKPAQQFRDEWNDNGSKINKQNSKKSKTESNFSISGLLESEYVYNIVSQKKGEKEMKSKFEVKEMQDLNLVYTSHTGSFEKIGGAYEKLMRWAGPRGLLASPDLKTVTVYHDDPNVTEIEKVRQSACITVDSNVKTEGEFGNLSVPGGRYAVGSFEISDQEFGRAWDSVCHWIAENGYQPEDGLPYELYHNDHMEHPEQKFIVDICIPVRPM